MKPGHLVAYAASWIIAGSAFAAADDPIVELPPMVVVESPRTPPWFYVKTDDAEYLSRCTAAVTHDFVAADQRQFQLLRAFIPDAFLLKMDVPSLVILDRVELKPAGDAIMQDMVRIAAQRPVGTVRLERSGPRVLTERVHSLLNLRIDDRDLNALFAYLDQRTFNGDSMVLTSGYVQFLLERRTPDLPGWLIAGATAIFEQAAFVGNPITVHPFVWISPKETDAILRNPDWPRALLPMNELLATDVMQAESDRDPARRAVWSAQAALFFRWAQDPRNGMRDAFWKFVGRASEAAVSEKLFEECFGFGYSEARDRLSDYLPVAVKEPFRIDP